MSRILITGSSRGLGRSIALVFAKNNSNVILHGRNKDSLQDVKSSIMAYDVDCDVVSGDLVASDTVNRLLLISKEKEGIDILINNAGIYLNKPFLETSMEEFRKVIETNFMSVVSLTAKLFPIMKSKGSGLIININSLAGKAGSMGESAYCASKHALRGFSSSLQFDATKYGIRIVDVYIGAMRTEMAVGRIDRSKFISTDDAAKSIFDLSKNYKTMRITEMNINRMIY